MGVSMRSKLKHLKIPAVLVLALLIFSKMGMAQYMEFEWSDEYRFTNKKTGFFTDYVGTSNTTIYTLQRNISKSKPYDNARLKLVAMNKISMTEDTVVALKGFPENEGNAALYKDLDYLTTVVTDEGIFVFWRKLYSKEATRHEEIYAQSLRFSLKENEAVRKVYEFTNEVEDQVSIFDSTRCVIAANKELGKIVIGAETFENGILSFQFITLDGKLKPSAEKRFPLPHKLKKLPNMTTSTYELRKNGKLCIQSDVAYTKRELEGKEQDHPQRYLAFTVADMTSAQHHTIKISAENKTITDYGYQDVAGKTRLIGFFGDLEQDTSGIDDQGVFYADIDNATMKSTGLRFVPFERTIKNRIMSKKDRRKRNAEVPQEEILNTRFDIEHIEEMPDSSLVLFFTMEYNTEEILSRSDLGGRNVYYKEQSFKKTDVLALRFTNEGTCAWARKIERTAAYENEDQEDVQVVFKHGKFIVLYGNVNPKLKGPRKRKLRHLKEEIEYASFDPKSGRAKIYEVEVNEPKTPLKEMRYVDPKTAIAIDGTFYFYQIRVRQNPLWTAANVVFLPTLYYTILTGNTQLGKGDFAVMRVQPGRKPKRKR